MNEGHGITHGLGKIPPQDAARYVTYAAFVRARDLRRKAKRNERERVRKNSQKG